jgi:hypothetical protein
MQQMMNSKRLPGRTPVFLLSEESVFQALWPVQNPFSRGRTDEMPAKVAVTRNLMTDRARKDDLKWYLMNKYYALFVDKLTREDLEELRYCLRHQYDPKRGWDRDHLRRFVLKMKEYMEEEILKREIAGIVSLLTLMNPEDLIPQPGLPRITKPARV